MAPAPPAGPPPVAQHVPWRRVDLTAEQIVVKEAAIRAHDS
jgi:hypothetical protein